MFKRKEKEIIECPNCGSLATNETNLFATLSLAFLLVGGLISWIPILGWICFPICLLGSLICLPFAFIGKKKYMSCRSCRYTWTELKVKNK